MWTENVAFWLFGAVSTNGANLDETRGKALNDEKPLEAAAEGAARELVQQLWSDAKACLPFLARKLTEMHRRATTSQFDSLPELRAALLGNQVENGALVKVACKPSPFGPYLRSHFLSPIIGRHTSLRLGPPLVHPNPVMAIMAQATSQLMPVGLYPAIAANVNQVSLYPTEATAIGFVGLMPGINELVPSVPALIASRFLSCYGKPCEVTGVARLVDPTFLSGFGVGAERYEALRQQGAVWFLDATTDEAQCTPFGDDTVTELWGGIYASGHLEIGEGRLEVAKLVEGFGQAFADNGFEPDVQPNLAGRREIMVFAKGLRACVDTQQPFYSLHMDAELALDFDKSRQKFDRACKSILNNIRTVCSESSVDLKNPDDLDFSYTSSSKAFTVMKSMASDRIYDPLAISIRDWHRLRGA